MTERDEGVPEQPEHGQPGPEQPSPEQPSSDATPADPPSPDPTSPVTATDSPQPAPEPSSTSRSGVTMPVAVPLTVALVLGLAIGLILGWLIPRPGDSAAAADDAVVTVDDPPTADDGGTVEGSAQASEVLSPTTPSGVPGGPAGTDQYGGLAFGEGDTLVEVFEDYVCPFCAQFELSAGAELRTAAESGEYTLVLHPIAFLTDDSPRAANASACVYEHEDTATWVAFHETVYERQNPNESVGQYTTDILLGIADEVGATAAQTSECISDETFVPWVEAITQQAFDRGVRGTPTLAVDGTVTDVTPFVQ